MKRSDAVWTAWLTGLLTVFAVFEVPALRRSHRERGKPSGTLTYYFRGILGTRPGEKRRRRWVCGGGFACFCAYLAIHMSLGWLDS